MELDFEVKPVSLEQIVNFRFIDNLNCKTDQVAFFGLATGKLRAKFVPSFELELVMYTDSIYSASSPFSALGYKYTNTDDEK